MNEFQIILQARMGSRRLPGKVLMDLLNKPMLSWQIESLKKLKIPIVVASSSSDIDDPIEQLTTNLGVFCFRGSEDDVYSRFKAAIEVYPATNILRVTGDCPLVSPAVITKLLHLHIESKSDYSSNFLVRSFPDGLDVEVFTHQAFERLDGIELTDYQREHVTPAFYQYSELFTTINLLEERNLGNWRWTIDYPSDFAWLEAMLSTMQVNQIPEYEEILNFLEKNNSFKRVQRDTGIV